MDDVAEILSGNYGIRQQSKSTPMAACKPSKITTFATSNGGIANSGTPSALTEVKIPLSSSKNDCLLESLGFRLTEIEGLGFEELVKGGDAPVDPFLFFEKDLSCLHQFSGETKVISPAANVAGTGSDSFDIFEDFGRSNSSLLSERNVNAGKIRACSAFQNPSYAQKPPMGDFLDSNPNSSAPKPPILENFDFCSMYDTAVNEKKERAFTEAREEENTSYNGIESFFSGIGLGGTWPPTHMEATPENTMGGAQRVPTTSNISIKESSFMKNMIGDLSKSEDIEGDNEYRRQARYEREQKKSARAAKALAEKNSHDFALQREQNEREMIAEELDIEVKQWAAGREGNLRALLSTLQDVLWPECGWQPVSLANLMTSSAVKKVYGKAALCIHPDKVQQKGSNIRQKYVAEKVFYILTEALNKFSSEELR